MFVCIHGQQLPAKASLVEFAYAFSPLVEETAPDTVVLDVEGVNCDLGLTMNLPLRFRNRRNWKNPPE